MASMDLTDSMDLSLSKLQEIVKDRETKQAAAHAWQSIGASASVLPMNIQG